MDSSPDQRLKYCVSETRPCALPLTDGRKEGTLVYTASGGVLIKVSESDHEARV